jgi:hypothetical protein
MTLVVKVVLSVAAFLAGIATAAFASRFLFEQTYPAYVMVAALILASPALYFLWRDKAAEE